MGFGVPPQILSDQTCEKIPPLPLTCNLPGGRVKIVRPAWGRKTGKIWGSSSDAVVGGMVMVAGRSWVGCMHGGDDRGFLGSCFHGSGGDKTI